MRQREKQEKDRKKETEGIGNGKMGEEGEDGSQPYTSVKGIIGRWIRCVTSFFFFLEKMAAKNEDFFSF